MASEFHVATTGSDSSDGSRDRPLRTINRAAERAQAGDTVVVHEGVYREWVRPRNGGLSDSRRITYQAATGEHVVIKGSEQVTGWEPAEGGTWKVSVPNTLFGSFNPFLEEIEGDWIVYAEKDSPKKHLGDVYLNGTSFYEVLSLQEVSDPKRRTEVLDDWTGLPDRVRNPSRRSTSGTPRSGTTRPRSGRTSRGRTRTRSWSRSMCGARSSTPPSTISTSSPSAASNWRRRPARGPRPPRTSRA